MELDRRERGKVDDGGNVRFCKRRRKFVGQTREGGRVLEQRESKGSGSGYDILDEYERLFWVSTGMSVSSRFLQDQD